LLHQTAPSTLARFYTTETPKVTRPEIADYLGEVLQLNDRAKCLDLAHMAPQDHTLYAVQGLINFLEDRVGLDKKVIKKIVLMKYRNLLRCTGAKHFDPVISWLEDDIGFDRSQVRKVL
jgi:hypothetical protein